MNYTAVLLKPIDYFPLVSFYREQGISPVPRFTKPTESCMKSHAAIKIGTKIIAAAGVFPVIVSSGDTDVKAAYVGQYASMLDDDEIVSALAKLVSEMSAQSGCEVFFGEKCPLTDVLGFKDRAFENIYTLTKQSVGISGTDIQRVFAFVDLKVIMDEDLEQLKRVYASGCHYAIPDNDFRPAIASLPGKPVVVKDSMGKVTALLSVSGGKVIHSIFAQNPDDIGDILKAYMIMHGLESMEAHALPCDTQMCRAFESISGGCVCVPKMAVKAADGKRFPDGVCFPSLI